MSCNCCWEHTGMFAGYTPKGKERWDWRCSFCKEYRASSAEPYTRGKCCKGNCSCDEVIA